ncbi:hypothetical protein BOX15_Mlig014992g1 [Macrostomum lignano]|uniref:DUF4203 domain-containing protein n=1 Tax=Macrostomum lignano TaxID=282301 RepID=A0A267FX07_9PLAT|nr:hypothetical protein BOX15_Mlig014992g1 [Macrostomum lignano]
MTRLISTLRLVLLLAFLILPSQPAAAQTQPILPLGQARNFSISSKRALEVLVKYTPPENETVALRLETTSYSNASLLVVVRQQLTLHTWSLPYTFVDVSSTGDQSAVESFQSVTRTICPPHLSTQTPDQQQQQQQVYLRVTTESAALVTVSARAQLASNFRLSLGEPVQVLLQPSGPQLFFFDFDSGRANFTELRAVRILVESNDSACGLVSVQRSRCPADQVPPSVLQRGFRQTLLSSSVILMRRDEFNSSFLVVLTAFPDNRNCLANWEQERRQRFPSKSVTIKVEQIAMHDSEEWPLLGLTFLLGGFDCLMSIIFVSIFCAESCKHFLNIFTFLFFISLSVMSFALAFVFLLLWFFEKLLFCLILLGSGLVLLGILGAVRGYTRKFFRGFKNFLRQTYSLIKDSCRSIRDVCCECNRSCTFSLYCMHCRCCGPEQPEPFLNNDADNQGQPENQQQQPHASLVMQLTAIAIFYCLPVFQLVLLQQDSISSFGNLDECYYNFKCRFYVKTELTTFFAFNNAVSNVGYITAGIVFMVVVLWKQLFHDKPQATVQGSEEHHTNTENVQLLPPEPQIARPVVIPRSYSAHYAAGLALAMEGVLSACYHICPSHNTFQFDTTFMIMLSSMLGLAVYSKRHLSSGSVANVTFVALGVTVLVNSLGILFSLVSREFVFSVLGVVLLLLAVIALILRKKQLLQNFLTFLAAFVCFAAGIASFLVGFLHEHFLFAYFLLAVTAGSASLYFLYYCIRKCCRKTRPSSVVEELLYSFYSCFLLAFSSWP